MSNFISQKAVAGGVFLGSALVQAKGEIGGHRHVFVKLGGGEKNGLRFPTTGGVIVNPFKGNAKIFAGDLVEYNPNIATDGGATIKIMKTYKVVSASGTKVVVEGGGYRHVPFVGDVLMVAPAEATGTGTGATVTGVVKGKTEYTLTLSAAIDAEAGDVLVEATAAGADAKAMVANPNCYAACDYDFVYASTEDSEVSYLMAPCLSHPDVKIYEHKMSPLPAYVKAMNKSNVEGWFEL